MKKYAVKRIRKRIPRIKKIDFNNKFFHDNIAILTIFLSKNNIIFTFSNIKNNVFCWYSIRSVNSKLKGAKKKEESSIQYLVKFCFEFILKNEIKKIFLKLKGNNNNRLFLLEELCEIDYPIINIEENLNLPYNGCRPQKRKKI